MSFWRQFSRKWPQSRWKTHHFLSKCHGNFLTWTCPKSMSCFSMENNENLDKWHGMVMEFGVSFGQTAVSLWHNNDKISMTIYVTFWRGLAFITNYSLCQPNSFQITNLMRKRTLHNTFGLLLRKLEGLFLKCGKIQFKMTTIWTCRGM